MGMLNIFSKKKPAKPKVGQKNSTTSGKAPVSKPTVQKAALKSKKIQTNLSALEKVSARVPTREEIDLKLKEKNNALTKPIRRTEIKNNLLIEVEPYDKRLEFYCLIRPARIFFHSVLIDKLGDLTKFIISALYTGHSVEQISNLTQMGATTIKEEMDYLIHGGLVDDQKSLTELGLQYGRLIEIFDEQSEGIQVAFNTFANIFEPIDEKGYCLGIDSDTGHVLPKHFIPTLSRNDNYSNSLDIVIKQMEGDMPFDREVKKSLYTTVKIEKSELGYKRVCIEEIDSGKNRTMENEACIKIAIPCNRIQYRVRFKCLDPYRDKISIIEKINETHNDLLSDKAELIVNAALEERAMEPITVVVDTITGKLNSIWDVDEELPSEDSMLVLDRQKADVSLDSDVYKDIYLEEVSKEELYKVRYYPYSQMEVQ